MKSSSLSSPLRISFVTLGCAKNLVDSEKILGLLAEAGLVLVDSDDPAEAIIINTCGFLAEAREEAREQIELALEQKQAGRIGCVIVAGCLAQYWKEKLFREFPGIDVVVGLDQRDTIAEIVREAVRNSLTVSSALQEETQDDPSDRAKKGLVKSGEFRDQVLYDQARLRITEPCWAYLRISEGCDQHCTFCTIPSIRGPFRSKPVDAILAEAEELVADGAVELNLIAQETTSYGKDLEYQAGLAGLLRELNRIDGLRWIRVLYAYPSTMSEQQIIAMAECEKVVPYLDLPLQHINDRILKLMRRGINRSLTIKLLEQLRDKMNQPALRTTMLVGFPSETESEFEELMQFVQEYRFTALGGFIYSPEPGTPAKRMKEQVPEDVKQERLERLMLTQQEMAFEQAQSYVGSTVQCLITRPLDAEEIPELGLESDRRWYTGRHERQAPETDSECYLTSDDEVGPGAIVPARITTRRDYDLVGEIEDH